MEEKPKEVEAAAEAVETSPFHEQEVKMVGTLTEKFVETTKIDKKSMDVIDGLLASDTEKAYQNFALTWFKNNEAAMKKEGRVIPPGASDEWKIGMVLGSKEKGGMGAMADINDPKYSGIREGLDKQGVLKTDMHKEQVPPETPFLLLNYLQTGIEDAKREAKQLRVDAKNGDEHAAIMADSKEAHIKELYSVAKTLAEKATGEDLTETAKKRFGEEWASEKLASKEEWVGMNLDGEKKEIEAEKNKELIDKEWKAYMSLPEKERKKYQRKLGVKLEMPRDVHGELLADTDHTKEQVDADYIAVNQRMFHDGILARGKKNGIEGPAFYGMLEKGEKPYGNIQKVGMWPFNRRGTEILSTKNKPGVETVVDFNKAGEDYKDKIEVLAKTKLEKFWDKEHAQKINEGVEKRISELAKSPFSAEGGIEMVYQKAKERIVREYIEDYKKKEPKTKEQLASIEKVFSAKGIKKDVNKFFAATLFGEGRLGNMGDEFTDDDRIEMGGFLRGWGIKADISNTREITVEDYKKARKKQGGMFELLMKVIENSLKPRAKKRAA